jgi:hypothetical protein
MQDAAHPSQRFFYAHQKEMQWPDWSQHSDSHLFNLFALNQIKV